MKLNSDDNVLASKFTKDLDLTMTDILNANRSLNEFLNKHVYDNDSIKYIEIRDCLDKIFKTLDKLQNQFEYFYSKEE